jgi:hypothetical protein
MNIWVVDQGPFSDDMLNLILNYMTRITYDFDSLNEYNVYYTLSLNSSIKPRANL